MGLGGAFVIDFTERFRRVAEGIGILQLSSGDEISVQIPAEAQIISALALSIQRFDAFDLLCSFVVRDRQENRPGVTEFRMAALKVAGFDHEKLLWPYPPALLNPPNFYKIISLLPRFCSRKQLSSLMPNAGISGPLND